MYSPPHRSPPHHRMQQKPRSIRCVVSSLHMLPAYMGLGSAHCYEHAPYMFNVHHLTYISHFYRKLRGSVKYIERIPARLELSLIDIGIFARTSLSRDYSRPTDLTLNARCSRLQQNGTVLQKPSRGASEANRLSNSFISDILQHQLSCRFSYLQSFQLLLPTLSYSSHPHCIINIKTLTLPSGHVTILLLSYLQALRIFTGPELCKPGAAPKIFNIKKRKRLGGMHAGII
ncbi:hypothetical protein EV426DRAFT_250217 [Tirmania nivea]|nr:hypothetical protein EV426DRAFT_250217 [Tirmania nivea]